MNVLYGVSYTLFYSSLYIDICWVRLPVSFLTILEVSCAWLDLHEIDKNMGHRYEKTFVCNSTALFPLDDLPLPLFLPHLGFFSHLSQSRWTIFIFVSFQHFFFPPFSCLDDIVSQNSFSGYLADGIYTRFIESYYCASTYEFSWLDKFLSLLGLRRNENISTSQMLKSRSVFTEIGKSEWHIYGLFLYSLINPSIDNPIFSVPTRYTTRILRHFAVHERKRRKINKPNRKMFSRGPAETKKKNWRMEELWRDRGQLWLPLKRKKNKQTKRTPRLSQYRSSTHTYICV